MFKVQHSELFTGFFTYHGLIFISGMGAHVKKTVSSKKDLRPQTSDRAPMRGALRNDNRPWKITEIERQRQKMGQKGWVKYKQKALKFQWCENTLEKTLNPTPNRELHWKTNNWNFKQLDNLFKIFNSSFWHSWQRLFFLFFLII